MIIYKVFYKNYEFKRGELMGTLTERRKNLRGNQFWGHQFWGQAIVMKYFFFPFLIKFSFNFSIVFLRCSSLRSSFSN